MRFFIAIALTLLCFMDFATLIKGDCKSNCMKGCAEYIDFEWCKRIDEEQWCEEEQKGCYRRCDELCSGGKDNYKGDEYKKK